MTKTMVVVMVMARGDGSSDVGCGTVGKAGL